MISRQVTGRVTYARAYCPVQLEHPIEAVGLGNRTPARIVGGTFTWDGKTLDVRQVVSYKVKKDGTLGTSPGGVWDFKVDVGLFPPDVVAGARAALRDALAAALDAIVESA
jgi:hypothetical protein